MKRPLSLTALARAGACAALYVALTVTPPLSALSFGAVQLRVSEALVLLPFLFPETGIGIVLGCLISNLFSPNLLPLDLVLGTLASAIGVAGTLLCRRFRHGIFFASVPPILANALIVPVLFLINVPAESATAVYFSGVLTVGAGELVACALLGHCLLLLLSRLPSSTLKKEKS